MIATIILENSTGSKATKRQGKAKQILLADSESEMELLWLTAGELQFIVRKSKEFQQRKRQVEVESKLFTKSVG